MTLLLDDLCWIRSTMGYLHKKDRHHHPSDSHHPSLINHHRLRTPLVAAADLSVHSIYPNNTTMMKQYAPFLLLLLQAVPLYGWVTLPTPIRTLSSSSTSIIPGVISTTTPTSLQMAGFGDAKKTKEAKLKPKQQWDRYSNDLKKLTKFRVAVKAGDSDSAEWLEVGCVKSVENAYTEYAVAKQRSLIIEVRFVMIII